MNQEYTRAPHRPAAEIPQNNAALLIDFDNVTMGIRSNLGQELRNLLESDVIRGKVAVQRAYADWRRYPQYIVSLSEASIDLIFAPAYGSSKKNATDIRLAIDALELVFTRPEIATFILLSGDSDFSSLVLKLKEYGKYVIGVGLQESSSDILVQNCDEYYSYNRLSGFTSADDIQTQKHDPWELAQKAVARMAERGDVMRSDRLKQVMLEIDPSFDEKGAGYSKFNRFLGEAAQRELIRLHKRENGQYDVGPVEGGKTPTTAQSSPAPGREESSSRSSRSRRGRRGGRGRGGGSESGPSDRATETQPVSDPVDRQPATEGLQSAYDALVGVVQELSRGGTPVRDSMAKRKLLARDASFDEGVLGFSKFSLFLRQAHADGIVVMNQGEDGNYYLTSSSPAAGAASGSQGSPAASPPKSSVGGSPNVDTKVVGLDRKEGVLARTLGRFRRGSGPKGAETGGAASGQEREPRAPAPPERQAAGPQQAPKASSSQPRQGTGSKDQESRRSREGGRGRGRARTDDRPGDSQKSGSERSSSKPEARSRPEARSQAETRPKQKARPRPQARSQAEIRPKQEARPTPQARSQAETRPKQEARSEPAPERTPDPAPPAADPAPTAETPPPPPAPRRMGLRSGSRGRAKPAPQETSSRSRIGPISDDELRKPAASKPGSAPTKGPSKEPASTPQRKAQTPAEPIAGPVSHMIRNYAGVGKRTAEVLFESFGEDVFDVIDREPGRISEVLSEGRAKVVIDARRAERES